MLKNKLSSIDKFGKTMIIIVIGLFTTLLVVNIGLGIYTYFSYKKETNYKIENVIKEEASLKVADSTIETLTIVENERLATETINKNIIFDIFIENAEEFQVFISPNLKTAANIHIDEQTLIIDDLPDEKLRASIYITLPNHHHFNLNTIGTTQIYIKNVDAHNFSLSSHGLLDLKLVNSIIYTFSFGSIGEANLSSQESLILDLTATTTGKVQANLELKGDDHRINSTGVGNYHLTGEGVVTIQNSGYLRVNHDWSLGISYKKVVIA